MQIQMAQTTLGRPKPMKLANFYFMFFKSLSLSDTRKYCLEVLHGFCRWQPLCWYSCAKSRGQAVCLSVKKEALAAWVCCQVCVQFVFLVTAQIWQRVQREGHSTSEQKCYSRKNYFVIVFGRLCNHTNRSESGQKTVLIPCFNFFVAPSAFTEKGKQNFKIYLSHAWMYRNTVAKSNGNNSSYVHLKLIRMK